MKITFGTLFDDNQTGMTERLIHRMTALKVVLFLITTFLLHPAVAQRLNTNYRTVTDSTERLHYLVFTDKANCELVYPILNHGDAMVRQMRNYHLPYRVTNDTITFQITEPDPTHPTLQRLLQSKFIMIGEQKMFDTISGYTYVDDKLVPNRYDIYSVDGRIYKQKRTKTDGYGLIRRSYKQNRKLRKHIGKIDPDHYTVVILRGKEAYDKYGVIGMNGVIEIKKKKTF